MNAPRSPSRRTPLALCAALLLAACGGGGGGGSGGAGGPGIRVNQVGYAISAGKLAVVVGGAATTFQVIDEGTGLAVDLGAGVDLALSEGQTVGFSGEEVQVADFSALEAAGTYHLEVAGLEASPSFAVADDAYRAPALATLKAFYFWRASTAIDETHGGEWHRPAGHPNTGMSFHSTATPATTATTWNAPGGWYDAGDFGEYVVNAGITVGSMLAVDELYPGIVGDGATNIPESGNGKDDLLDEVKWELDWMLAMQDTDGGVFFKLAGLRWPGWVMPSQDTQARLVIGKSTTSALDFAAVMAQAGRVYQAYDATFADGCTAAAARAYRWAIAHPAVGAPDQTSGSGPYGDGDPTDEFTWAAAELHVTTGDPDYLDDTHLQAALTTVSLDGYAGWGGVKNLAYYSLARSRILGDAKTAELRAAIKARAEAHLGVMASNAYRFPLLDEVAGIMVPNFSWGSASQVANVGVLFAYAAEFADGPEEYARFRDGAVQAADFVLGRNTVDTSFITGVGTRSPLHPHNRQSQADGVRDPIPGLVTGGPNSACQDRGNGTPPVVYSGACSDAHPAYCWTDMTESYSSNEPAINQNAAAFFLLTWLDAQGQR